MTLLLKKNVNSTYMRSYRVQIVFDVLPPEETEHKLNVLFAFASAYTFAE